VARHGGTESARDLLDPRWKGKIVSTYPNDDDAVLSLYSLIVGEYGWEWLRRFVAQDVAWVRRTQESADRVERAARPSHWARTAC
jgi:ABC-type Fe3+ transport system substrate-binding protein